MVRAGTTHFICGMWKQGKSKDATVDELDPTFSLWERAQGEGARIRSTIRKH